MIDIRDGGGQVVIRAGSSADSDIKRKGYLFVLGAIVLFSTIEVVSKHLHMETGAGHVGPFQVATIRFVLGAVCLLPLLLLPERRGPAREALKRSWFPLAIMGGFGVFMTFTLFHWALDLARASTVAVIISMTPVFTAVIASLALGERLSALNWTGVLIGLLGAVLATTGLDITGLFSRSDFQGGVLALLATITWAAYTVWGKRYSEQYGGLVLSALTITVGAVMFVVFLAFRGGWGEVIEYSVSSWAWLFYLGVVATGLGYFLYFGGLRYVPASRGASLFYVKPVLAISIAFIFLGEPITVALLIAAFLAAGGVLLVTYEGENDS